MILTAHDGWISGLAFSSDGSTLYSSSWDNTVRRWTKKGDTFETEALLGHTGAIMAITFSADGQRMVTGSVCDIGSNIPNKTLIWEFGENQARLWKTLDHCTGWIRSLSGFIFSAICFTADGVSRISESLIFKRNRRRLFLQSPRSSGTSNRGRRFPHGSFRGASGNSCSLLMGVIWHQRHQVWESFCD